MDQLVNKLKKLLPVKKNTAAPKKVHNPNMPQTTAGLLIQLHSLVRQQEQTEAVLRQNMEKILEYKYREAIREYCKKYDNAVAEAYFADGGIRFHAHILLEHVSLLDPEYDTVKTMRIRCYNSAIAYMCSKQQALEQECWKWVQKIKDEESYYQDEANLFKAIGFVPCRDRIRGLKGMSPQQLARELPEIRQTVLANKKTIEQLLQRCEQQTEPITLQYINLLKALRSLLNTESVGRLGTEEGWSAADYAEAAARFAADVRERLLLKYPHPGKHFADAGKRESDELVGRECYGNE